MKAANNIAERSLVLSASFNNSTDLVLYLSRRQSSFLQAPRDRDCHSNLIAKLRDHNCSQHPWTFLLEFQVFTLQRLLASDARLVSLVTFHSTLMLLSTDTTSATTATMTTDVPSKSADQRLNPRTRMAHPGEGGRMETSQRGRGTDCDQRALSRIR